MCITYLFHGHDGVFAVRRHHQDGKVARTEFAYTTPSRRRRRPPPPRKILNNIKKKEHGKLQREKIFEINGLERFLFSSAKRGFRVKKKKKEEAREE